MKTYRFLVLLLAFAIFQNAQAQSDDEGIRASLNNYLEGGATGDTARLNRAFHPLANLRSLSKEGKVTEMTVKKFIGGVPAGGAKWNAKIVSYSYSGTAATAVTEEGFAAFKYIDFLNLLKINGEWKIVSRVFYRGEVGDTVTAFGGGQMSSSSVSASSSNSKVQPAAATSSKKPAPKPKPASDDGW